MLCRTKESEVAPHVAKQTISSVSSPTHAHTEPMMSPWSGSGLGLGLRLGIGLGIGLGLGLGLGG